MSGSGANPARRRGIVVVWHESASPPEDLLAALRARDVDCRIVADSYAAMAEVCRVPASCRLGGPGATPRPALILVEPDRLRDVSAVCETLADYAPGAVLWAYRAGPAGTRLAPLNEAARPPPQATARPASAESGGIEPKPLSVLADSDNWSPAGVRAGRGTVEPETDQPLLSPEELRMLIGEQDVGEGV